MSENKTLKFKCSQLGWADLQALKNLSEQDYNRLLANCKNEDEIDGIKDEQKSFSDTLTDVISNKVADLLED